MNKRLLYPFLGYIYLIKIRSPRLHPSPFFRSKILIIKRAYQNLVKGVNWNSIFNVLLRYKKNVANVHGYHLEHLCGLRKSRSERQK